MRIALCTTCKNRSEHLSVTLPRNIIDNAGFDNAVFVVLNYNSQDNLMQYLHDNHLQAIDNGRLVVYSHRAAGPFHVSHAKNMAARLGILEGANVLVTLDADNFTGPGFCDFVSNQLSDAAVSRSFLCPNFPLIHSLPHGPGRPERGYAGRLAILAQDFIKMGGYDETFDTWRGEDIDLISRLERIGYTMRHFDNGFLRAIPHNAEVRFKEYPHAKQYENKREVQTIYARKETVVNYGKLGMGDVYRNFSSTQINLGRVPTRIFGIGLHKTATTSLHAALQELGFDSLHWGTGEAPRIWNEMNSSGRSRTLEQWYAVSDLPIPLLYQKLDASYPGSKFILTVRDEKDWIKSVRHLWSADHNPNRWIWDVYPFTNKIHKELYGQKHFDPNVFIQRYRRHNADVKAYFRNRPDDLLVMDASAGDGWSKLCRFLGVPVPTANYPVRNGTVESVRIVQQRSTQPLTSMAFRSWALSGTYYY